MLDGLDINGTIIRITLESLKVENTVWKDTCMGILIYQVTQGFFNDVSITLNDKIDPKNPTKRED